MKRHVRSRSTHRNLRYENASTTRNGSFVSQAFTTELSGANISRRLCTHVGCTWNEHARAARTRLPHKRHDADEYAATVRDESLTCGAMRSSCLSSHRIASHAPCTALLLSTETAPSARSADAADLLLLVVLHASAARSEGTARKIHDQTWLIVDENPEKRKKSPEKSEIIEKESGLRKKRTGDSSFCATREGIQQKKRQKKAKKSGRTQKTETLATSATTRSSTFAGRRARGTTRAMTKPQASTSSSGGRGGHLAVMGG